MGVWETLTLEKYLSIQKLQVLGDSKLVIEWLTKKGRLQTCAIESWKIKILDLIKDFHEIIFQHIYRDHNKEVDTLSKKSSLEPEGRITYYN